MFLQPDLVTAFSLNDVHEIKKLDEHIVEFLNLLQKDIKTHTYSKVKEHSKTFDREVHEELDRLMDLTKEDLALYVRVIKTLAKTVPRYP